MADLERAAPYLKEAYDRGILPDDMKATYEEARKRGLIDHDAGSWTETGMDMLKAIPRGLTKGVAGIAGSMGDLRELLTAGGEYIGVDPRITRNALKATLPVAGTLASMAPTTADVTKGIEHVTGPLGEPKTTAGRYTQSIAEFVPSTFIGGPEGVAAKLGTAALGGVGGEVGKELTGGSKLGGFAGSLAAQVLPSILRRGIAPGGLMPKNREESVEYLRSRGVEPLASQITGNRRVGLAESHLGKLPGSGGALEREQERVNKEYTAAANEHMGEPDAERATPEVIERARDRLGKKFEEVAKKLPILFSRQLNDDITDIAANLMKEGLPDATIKRITAQIDNVMKGFVTRNPSKSGTTRQAMMDGKTYQALTRHGTPLQRAIDDPDPNISYYATLLRSAVDDAMEATAKGRGTRPGVGRRQAYDDLRQARRQWYNMMVISKAAAGSNDGYVTPQKLRQLLTSSEDKKLQYAAGRGDMHALARAGNEILTQIPTSQTAERLAIYGVPASMGAAALEASQGNFPMAAGMAAAPFVPGVAGRAVLSETGQNWLKGALADTAGGKLIQQLPESGGVPAWLRSYLATQGVEDNSQEQ